MSEEERKANDAKNNMANVLGGGDGAAEELDGDAVLKMIAGVGGAEYKELDEEGNIIEAAKDGPADISAVLRELRGMRAEQSLMRQQQLADSELLKVRVSELEDGLRRIAPRRGPIVGGPPANFDA